MAALTLIPLASLICYSILFIVNIRHDLRNRINRSFTVYLFTMIIWSLGSLLAHIDHPALDPVVWNRFMIIGSTAMPVAFFRFVSIFLKKERGQWLAVGVISYLIIQAANVFGYVIIDACTGRSCTTPMDLQYFTSISWVLFIGLSTLDL
jgi:hypothetical protein